MDRELRILMLEDESTDAELAQRELRNAGITLSSMLVDSREEFIKGLEEFSPDVILADYKLPSFDGISALGLSQEMCPDIPFIFVTGTMGEEWAVETLKRGACDYVLKDRIYRLASVVKRALQDAKERTERKQVEEKYRGLFENALEGIFQILPDGSFITVNPAFVNMLGYKSSSEFIATVTDLGHQLYVQPERYNELKQLLDKHSVVHEFEIQMYLKDGSIIWISLNARAICDDHGTLLYYEGTAQDITEQKKIRDVIKPSTLLLRIMGIFAVAEVLIMLFLSFTDIPHGIWENLTDAILLTILSAPFVYWWIVKGLTRHLVHEVSVAQTEAQVNEYRYQTLIDTAPDIVYTLAAGDGMITLLNPAFETVTGFLRDEWIGKTFASLVHPDDLQFAIEKFQQILGGKNPPPYELRILTKSGIYLVGEFTSVPQFELGKIVGVLGIARDITERKRAEKEIAMLAHSLKSINECVSITDMEDKILFVNESFLKTYGYDENELVGKHVNIVRSLNNPPDVVKEILPATLRGGWQGELWNKRKDGSDFPIYLSTKFINDKDNKPLGLIGVATDITERKRTEKEIREYAEQYRTMVSATLFGFWLVDEKGKLLDVNDTYCSMSGYTREELLNLSVPDLEVFDKPKDVTERIKRIIKNGAEQFESKHKAKDGRVFDVEISTSFLYSTKQLIVFIRDITERKHAEEALRESEASLAKAQRIAHIGNWELDILTHKLFWSDEVYRIFGFEIGAFGHTMESFTESVHPDDRGLMNEVTQASWYEKKPFDVDHRIILPSGKVRVVHEMAEVIFNESAQPMKMVGTVQDITERKHAEELQNAVYRIVQAADRAENLDSLYSSIHAIIREVMVADNFYIALYDEKDDLLSFPYFIDEEDAPILHKKPGKGLTEYVLRTAKSVLCDEVLFEELIQRSEIELVGVNSPIWLGVPLIVAGKAIGVMVTQDYKNAKAYGEREKYILEFVSSQVAVAIDRKRAEEKEKGLQAQLQQAQKLESLGTLASGIAHDFNNILGIIMGHTFMVDMLKSEPEKMTKNIDAINKATMRGASLVKQLLTFARKTEVLFTSVDINDTISEITKLMRETFPKTIVISTTLQTNLPAIFADTTQIHQVFLNLCVNARDAMPNNGTLSISTSVVDGKTISSQYPNVTVKQYVRVKVTDSGMGMDESTRKRIFEPFFTTKDIGKGTGLGLATVFGIVERFNSFIDVQSTVGEGTTFTIYFPIPEHASTVTQTDYIRTTEILGGTETILLIEDEEMIRELVQTVLMTKGYKVLTAEDGQRGVEMYQSYKNEISLVLSDMGLPLLSGHDVAKHIRKINPEAKIIIASGFIEPEIKTAMVQSGIKHFIQKPYSHDDVLQKVREVIDTNE